MWGYRLERADREILLTWPVSVIRNRLEKAICSMGGSPSYRLAMFDREHKHAHQIAKALGWDGTFVAEPNCFSLPMPDSEMWYGFVITQATSAQRYITSPVPLQYLDDAVDFDAKISDEEVMRIRGHLTGSTPIVPEVHVGEWKRSRANNMYTDINGTNVTIIKSGNGFKAMIPIHADKSKSIFTKVFKTELEASHYVVANFNTLIDALRREGGIGSANNSPLAGVKWGDDDDDIPF